MVLLHRESEIVSSHVVDVDQDAMVQELRKNNPKFDKILTLMEQMLNSLEQLKTKSAPMEVSPSSDLGPQDTILLESSKNDEINKHVVIDIVSDDEIPISVEHELILCLEGAPSSKPQSEWAAEVDEDEAVSEKLLPDLSSSVCQDPIIIHQDIVVCNLEVPLDHSRVVSFDVDTLNEDVLERYTVFNLCTQAVCENAPMTFSPDSHLLWCFMEISGKYYEEHNLLVLHLFGEHPPRPPEVIHYGYLEAKKSVYRLRDVFTNEQFLKQVNHKIKATWNTFVKDLNEHFKQIEIILSQSEVWDLLSKMLDEGAHLRPEMEAQSLAYKRKLAGMKSYSSSLTTGHICIFKRNKTEKLGTEQHDYKSCDMDQFCSIVYLEPLMDIVESDQLVTWDMLMVVGSIEDSNNDTRVSCGSTFPRNMFLSEVAFSSMPYMMSKYAKPAKPVHLNASESYKTCLVDHGILFANKESKYDGFQACKAILDVPKRLYILSANHNVQVMLVFDSPSAEPPDIFFSAPKLLNCGIMMDLAISLILHNGLLAISLILHNGLSSGTTTIKPHGKNFMEYEYLMGHCHRHFMMYSSHQLWLQLLNRRHLFYLIVKKLVADALTDAVPVEVMTRFDSKRDIASYILSCMMLTYKGSCVICYFTNHQTSVLSSIQRHESLTWSPTNTCRGIHIMKGYKVASPRLSKGSMQVLEVGGNECQCVSELSIWMHFSFLDAYNEFDLKYHEGEWRKNVKEVVGEPGRMDIKLSKLKSHILILDYSTKTELGSACNFKEQLTIKATELKIYITFVTQYLEVDKMSSTQKSKNQRTMESLQYRLQKENGHLVAICVKARIHIFGV